MTQLTLDDARRQRDAALDAVERNADERWKDAALAAVRHVCELRPDFHVDDIWTLTDLPSTREDRALGPVMLRAARLGWCRKTDRVRPSARSHGSGKPVWQSLLYTARNAAALPPITGPDSRPAAGPNTEAA